MTDQIRNISFGKITASGVHYSPRKFGKYNYPRKMVNLLKTDFPILKFFQQLCLKIVGTFRVF